jgi:CHAT domain
MPEPRWYDRVRFPQHQLSPHRTVPRPKAAARPTAIQIPADIKDSGPPEQLTSKTVDPLAVLPDHVARLVVNRSSAEGKEVFTVQGFGSFPLPLTISDRYGRPKLGLEKTNVRSASGGHAGKLLSKLKDFSDPIAKHELLDWLDALLHEHGDNLRLTICDGTDFNIPWELLWIRGDPESGRRAGPLGTVATVIRDLGYPVGRHSAILRRSATHSTEARCKIAFYVAPDVDADAVVSAAVQRFHRTPYTRFDDLLRDLADPGREFGTVYVGAHGLGGEDAEDLRMIDKNTSLSDIDTLISDGLPSAPDLVILSVCHSGYAVLDRSLNDATPRSFARSFLRGGARGVIGTTGEVGVAAASTLVSGLLDQLHDDRALSVAVALRDQRRRIAKLVIDNPSSVTEDAARQLIFAGMYAYFGDPDVTVALAVDELGKS